VSENLSSRPHHEYSCMPGPEFESQPAHAHIPAASLNAHKKRTHIAATSRQHVAHQALVHRLHQLPPALEQQRKGTRRRVLHRLPFSRRMPRWVRPRVPTSKRTIAFVRSSSRTAPAPPRCACIGCCTARLSAVEAWRDDAVTVMPLVPNAAVVAAAGVQGAVEAASADASGAPSIGAQRGACATHPTALLCLRQALGGSGMAHWRFCACVRR
jgi:hypothetical protein